MRAEPEGDEREMKRNYRNGESGKGEKRHNLKNKARRKQMEMKRRSLQSEEERRKV